MNTITIKYRPYLNRKNKIEMIFDYDKAINKMSKFLKKDRLLIKSIELKVT